MGKSIVEAWALGSTLVSVFHLFFMILLGLSADGPKPHGGGGGGGLCRSGDPAPTRPTVAHSGDTHGRGTLKVLQLI